MYQFVFQVLYGCDLYVYQFEFCYIKLNEGIIIEFESVRILDQYIYTSLYFSISMCMLGRILSALRLFIIMCTIIKLFRFMCKLVHISSILSFRL